MKILVFGARGRVGEVLCTAAKEAGHELLTPTREQCDLTKPEEVSDFVLGSMADLVENSAAISRVEECEEDALRAHMVNAMSPAAMALACRHTGARFIHLSTDYVLDGRKPGIKGVNARCKPVNTYGMSKAEAEIEIGESNAEALILRISWVCGNPAKPSFVEDVLSRALREQKVAAVVDQDSMPTHVRDVARVILSPQLKGVRGVLQVTSGGEPMSRYDCVQVILEHAGALGVLSKKPVVETRRLREVNCFRVPRPAHTAMDNSGVLALGILMPSGRECIRRAVEEYLLYTRN